MTFVTAGEAIFYIAYQEFMTWEQHIEEQRQIAPFYEAQVGKIFSPVPKEDMLVFVEHIANGNIWSDETWEKYYSDNNISCCTSRYCMQQALDTVLLERMLSLECFIQQLKISVEHQEKHLAIRREAEQKLLDAACEGKIIIQGRNLGTGRNENIPPTDCRIDCFNIWYEDNNNRFVPAIPYLDQIVKECLGQNNPNREWEILRVIKEDVTKQFPIDSSTNALKLNLTKRDKAKERWQPIFDEVKRRTEQDGISENKALKDLFTSQHQSVGKIKNIRSFMTSYRNAKTKYGW